MKKFLLKTWYYWVFIVAQIILIGYKKYWDDKFETKHNKIISKIKIEETSQKVYLIKNNQIIDSSLTINEILQKINKN